MIKTNKNYKKWILKQFQDNKIALNSHPELVSESITNTLNKFIIKYYNQNLKET